MNISVPDNFRRKPRRDRRHPEKYKTIAVVGLSSNPRVPSFSVTQYMQSAGYRIIPVNPNETEVLGEKSYARLEDIPKSIQIEIVDIFRRSEYIPPIVDSAIAIGAKVIWMQQGIENQCRGRKSARRRPHRHRGCLHPRSNIRPERRRTVASESSRSGGIPLHLAT